ncbi:MAG TPA: hypothetical protein VMZ27_12370 [Candidatus Saccharimonadales bacterium]|nr:hypothetical protein [Candidatus Saccharimonadales bacterium]
MPAPMAAEIFEFTHANDKPLYKVTLEAVAQARKVRGVFLERQPRAERYTTMAGTLSRPGMMAAANNLISNWLIKKHNAVLVDFLDSLKIKHEKGVVEDLPPQVEDALLDSSVEQLLAKYPHEVVSIYLHAFNEMNEANWPNLKAKLETDSRLALKHQA